MTKHISTFLNKRKEATEQLLKTEKDNEIFIETFVKSLAYDIANLSLFFKGEEGFNFITKELIDAARELKKHQDEAIKKIKEKL